MFQGQICWIEARTTAPEEYKKLSGWFQKLRDECSNTPLFYKLGTGEKLNVNLVDESLGNKLPNLPYEVILIVPTELQAKCCTVGDEMISTVCMHQVTQELESIDRIMENKRRELEAAKRTRAELDALNALKLDIAKTLEEASEDGVPKFYYAYGKHDALSREYCWRVPFHLREAVKPGVTAVVQARDGHDRCVITRVEVSPQLMNHKLVVSVDCEQKSA